MTDTHLVNMDSKVNSKIIHVNEMVQVDLWTIVDQTQEEFYGLLDELVTPNPAVTDEEGEWYIGFLENIEVAVVGTIQESNTLLLLVTGTQEWYRAEPVEE